VICLGSTNCPARQQTRFCDSCTVSSRCSPTLMPLPDDGQTTVRAKGATSHAHRWACRGRNGTTRAVCGIAMSRTSPAAGRVGIDPACRQRADRFSLTLRAGSDSRVPVEVVSQLPVDCCTASCPRALRPLPAIHTDGIGGEVSCQTPEWRRHLPSRRRAQSPRLPASGRA
jgi:hypothetical protein